ncbi:MAG: DUF839 domain-containing protein [Sandaracinaceae bacterium]|nr:DUF839 domain-containing protein [Sandaracinaceae bacterium]
MSGKLTRRAWLGAGAAALALPAGAWLATRGDGARATAQAALRPDPRRVLDLHEGFTYQVVDRAGGTMSDGFRAPARPDGMACFAGEGGALVLMRNHELPAGLRSRFVGARWPDAAYDPEAGGAVSRLVLDPATLEVRAANLVLCGTSMNCSGGASPWGWLSGEEDARDPSHGFVFLCDPSATAAARPARIDAYGRFKHEAVALVPGTHVAYLTEDRGDGCLYRFVPHDPARPFEGRLQAMRVRGRPGEDTSPLATGERREVGWVELPEPVRSQDDLRHVARRAGAASVRRGEGAAHDGAHLYVAATTGGPLGAGQILRVEDGPDGGVLDVLAASDDRARMDMPDNLALAPDGSLWFAEDGRGHDCVRTVRADGSIVTLARNAASEGEIAGLCFSPSGDTLFANLQEEGLTVAIRGPFTALGA